MLCYLNHGLPLLWVSCFCINSVNHFPTHPLSINLEQVSEQHHSFAARTSVNVTPRHTGPLLFVQSNQLTVQVTLLSFDNSSSSKCNSRTSSQAQPCCLPLLPPSWHWALPPSSTTVDIPSTMLPSAKANTPTCKLSKEATPSHTLNKVLASLSSWLPTLPPVDPSLNSNSPGLMARSPTICPTLTAILSQLVACKLSHPSKATLPTLLVLWLTALPAKPSAPLPTTPQMTSEQWCVTRTPVSPSPCAPVEAPSEVLKSGNTSDTVFTLVTSPLSNK